MTDQLLKRTHERSGPGMTNRGENPGSDQAPRAISRMRRVTGSQQGRELNHWCVTGHGKKIKRGPPWTAHHQTPKGSASYTEQWHVPVSEEQRCAR